MSFDLEKFPTPTQSPELNELAAALSLAQGEIAGAAADSENPHFRSKYADLDSCWAVAREPLAKNGLAVIQSPVQEGGEMMLETLLVHKSGQFKKSFMPLYVDKKDMQRLGSAITYARRYAFSAMVGITQEDDDGNHAAKVGQNGKAARDPGPKPQAKISQPEPPKRPEPAPAAPPAGVNQAVVEAQKAAADAKTQREKALMAVKKAADECGWATQQVVALVQEVFGFNSVKELRVDQMKQVEETIRKTPPPKGDEEEKKAPLKNQTRLEQYGNFEDEE